MRIVALLVIAAGALAACGPGDVGADAGDDDPDGGGGSGLVVTWTGRGLGAPVDGVTIDRLRVSFRDLRVVGDAVQGDETYVAAQELDLEGDETHETQFDAAPPGMYSALELSIDGGADEETSWELSGSVVLDEVAVEWEIEDDGTLPVELALVGLDLPAGETRTIAVDLDAEVVVEGIDWASLQGKEDRITIEDDSPLMPAIRARLVDAFVVASID